MDGSITTNKGIALIGKLLAQKGALQITRVAVGDGTPPASPETLNALVHELKNATIESVDNPKNGEAKIVVQQYKLRSHVRERRHKPRYIAAKSLV